MAAPAGNRRHRARGKLPAREPLSVGRSVHWLPLAAAAAYVAILATTFERIVRAVFSNSDAASPAVIAQCLASACGHGRVVLGHIAYLSTLTLDLAAGLLPGHRLLWELVSYASVLAGIAVLVELSRQLAGAWAAGFTAAVAIAMSSAVLYATVAPAFHGTTWTTSALLAAAGGVTARFARACARRRYRDGCRGVGRRGGGRGRRSRARGARGVVRLGRTVEAERARRARAAAARRPGGARERGTVGGSARHAARGSDRGRRVGRPARRARRRHARPVPRILGLSALLVCAAFLGAEISLGTGTPSARYLVGLVFAAAAVVPLWAAPSPRRRTLAGAIAGVVCLLSVVAGGA
ncbi:MAG: hypothetical protein ACYDA3_11270, partial [Gaiellaceae bacterium]